MPFGAAWDNAGKGNWGEMAISLAGDAAMFLSGPLAGAAKACKTARTLRVLGAAAEAGVGVSRATQGVFAIKEGDSEKALGYFGEATLRLLGVSVQAIGLLKQGCFAWGTPVWTVAGPKRIEDIVEGDVLLSADENVADGPVVEKVVLALHRRLSAVVEVWIGGRCLKLTGEHPLYVRDEGWLAARSLRAGQCLRGHGGSWTPVEEVRDKGEIVEVFNLTVADYHTFFVGDWDWGFSVWVHNTDPLCEKMVGLKQALANEPDAAKKALLQKEINLLSEANVALQPPLRGMESGVHPKLPLRTSKKSEAIFVSGGTEVPL